VSAENTKINIVPNYITRPVWKYNEESKTPAENCLCNGRYCATYEPSNGFLSASNENVLIESIRQKCIYKITNSSENAPSHLKNQHMIYWNYMQQFHKTCMAQNDFSLSCSREILKGIDLNLNSLVEECFISSFQYDDSNNKAQDHYLTCTRNSILEEDSTAVEARLKNILPLVFVNDFTFYGSYTHDNILEAMCANLKEKPSLCFNDLPEVFIKEGGLTITHFALIIVVFIMFNLCVMYYCKRMSNKKLNNEVTAKDINGKITEIVQRYIALKDVKN